MPEPAFTATPRSVSDQPPPPHPEILPPPPPLLMPLSDYTPRPARWLWPHRLPLAKLTLLAGDPGVGKSILATHVAARVTAALPWPDGSPQPDTEPHNVVFCCSEDDPADTILEDGKTFGFSEAIIRRASQRLAVHKSPDVHNGPWSWQLPPQRFGQRAQHAQYGEHAQHGPRRSSSATARQRADEQSRAAARLNFS